MGIRGLITRLEPYQKDQTLSCTNHECLSHTSRPHHSIIIDGPGLAYYVYGRLIAGNPARDVFRLMPSYRTIGEALCETLQTFEAGGIRVRHILFDGALPENKRATRVQRLRDSSATLAKVRDEIADGFPLFPAPQQNALNTTGWSVFSYSQPNDVSRSKGPRASSLPVPFLVPAAFEALRSGPFVDQTKLVPGEADGFLAAAARESTNQLVLTGDSDLAIHDLGRSSLIFFPSLDVQPCSMCNKGLSISARTLRQLDLVEKIGPEATALDLIQVGFETHQDAHITLAEAIRRIARRRAGSSEKLQTTISSELTKFSMDYLQPASLSTIDGISPCCRELDNRTSELVQSVMSGGSTTNYLYLLPMIENPQRATAWLQSRSIRELAYAMLQRNLEVDTVAPGTSCSEIYRGGQGLSETVVKPNLGPSEISDKVHILEKQLGTVVSTLPGVKRAHACIIWAAVHVHQWHLKGNLRPPVKKVLSSALGSHGKRNITWNAVHLRAQIQGTLFSLRMLEQMRGVCEPGSSPAGQASEQVSPLCGIMLNDTELSDAGLARYSEQIRKLAEETRGLCWNGTEALQTEGVTMKENSGHESADSEDLHLNRNSKPDKAKREKPAVANTTLSGSDAKKAKRSMNRFNTFALLHMDATEG